MLTFQICAAFDDAFILLPATQPLFLLLHDPQTSRAVLVVRPVARVTGLAGRTVVSLPVPELHRRCLSSRDEENGG